MATLALAVGGSVLAGSVNLPPGIGFAVGALAGRMLFGPDMPNQKVEGPRLRDLRNSDSVLGAPIPIPYGQVRIACQLIWSPPLIERRHKTKVGGKGMSSSQKVVNYTYSMNAAYKICEGPILGVIRVWADTKLLYDSGGGGELCDPAFPLPGGMRLYLGTEEQEPDPLIEATEAYANAYRGVAYLVFEDFPLEDYGNRRPTISVELGGATEEQLPTIAIPGYRSMISPDGRFLFGHSTGLVPPTDFFFNYSNLCQWTLPRPPPVLPAPRRLNLADNTVLTGTQAGIPSGFEFFGPTFASDRNYTAGGQDPERPESYYAFLRWAATGEIYPVRINRTDGEIVRQGAGLSTYGSHAYPGSGVARPIVAGGSMVCTSLAGELLVAGNRGPHVGISLTPGFVPWGVHEVATYDTATLTFRSTTDLFTIVGEFGPATGRYRVGYGFIPDHMARSFQFSFHVWVVGQHWGTALLPMQDVAGINPTSGANPYGGATTGQFGDEPACSGISLLRVSLAGAIDSFSYDVADGDIRSVTIGGTVLRSRPAIFEPIGATGFVFMCVKEKLYKINVLTGEIVGTLALWTLPEGEDWMSLQAAGVVRVECALGSPYRYTQMPADADWLNMVLPSATVYEDEFGFNIAPSWGVANLNTMTWRSQFQWTQESTGGGLPLTGIHVPSEHAILHDLFLVDGLTYLDKRDTAGTGTTLAAIVRDICLRCGLTDDDIDVSDLDDLVRGYTLPRRSPAASFIEPLQTAYFFHPVESDWILKWRKERVDPIRTIHLDELAAHTPAATMPSSVTDTLLDELDLPERIDLTFVDLLRDHQPNNAHSRRPRASVLTRHQKQVSLPVVFEGSLEPRSIAERHLYKAWFERPETFALGPRHMDLEPMDVVTLYGYRGPIEIRITSMVDGLDGVLLSEGLRTGQGVIESHVVADDPVFPGQGGSTTTAPPTRAVFLDIPSLLPEMHRPSLLVAAEPAGEDWIGATVYIQAADASLTEVGRLGAVSTTGRLAQPLPAARTTTVWDLSAEAEVELDDASHTLDSATRLEVLDGANMAALSDSTGGWELFQWQTATQLGSNRWRLSGLLRGRFGTEAWALRHLAGAPFILLDSRKLLLVPLTLAQIGSPLTLRVVSDGQSIDAAIPRQVTPLGRSIQSWPPVHLVASRSTVEAEIAFTRRGRIDNDLRPFVDVPLQTDELPETYRLDVLDGSSVVRTLEADGNRVAIYSVAQVQSDFGDRHGWRCTLVNASFEATSGGWTATGAWFVPTSSLGLQPLDGLRFLEGGVGQTLRITQTIDLHAERGLDLSVVATGGLAARFEAGQANITSQHRGQLTVEALDAAGVVLGSASSTLVAVTPTLTWQLRAATLDPLPAATRSVRVTLRAERGTTSGAARVAFDDARLYLNNMVGRRRMIARMHNSSVGPGLPSPVLEV